MRSAGTVTYPTPGHVAANCSIGLEPLSKLQAGRILMGEVLDPIHRSIISAMAKYGQNTVQRSQIAEDIGKSANAGYFNNSMGKLCSMGIVNKSGNGGVSLPDWVLEIVKDA